MNATREKKKELTQHYITMEGQPRVNDWGRHARHVCVRPPTHSVRRSKRGVCVTELRLWAVENGEYQRNTRR